MEITVETKGVPESLGSSARMTSRSLKVGYSSEEKTQGEAQWVRQQRKAFLRWCNAFLIQRSLAISGLEEDLASGVLLCNLLELLSGKKLPNFTKAPKMKVQKVLNSQIALDWITKVEKLKLVGIGPEDIFDGKTKLILGLIWTLILRYQIQAGKWTVAGKKTTAKTELLEWCNVVLGEDGLQVNDFSNDWKSGAAFNSLHNYLLKQKQKQPLVAPSGAGPFEIIDLVFEAASAEFQIPKLLDANDMDEPDELSVMTYVSYFRQKDELSPEDHLKRREAAGAGSSSAAPSTSGGARAIASVSTEGAGLSHAVCGDLANFSCVTKDEKGEIFYQAHTAFYGTLELPPHTVTAAFEDKKSGVYVGSYTLETAGIYELNILYNDKTVSSKPFRVVAEPGQAFAPVCYADGKGLTFTRCGDSNRFKVVTLDKFSNLITKGGNKIAVKFDGPEPITGSVKDDSNGSYQVDYTITKKGPFKIHVTCNGEGIKGSPFELVADAGEPEAQYVVSEGEGLKTATAGELSKFLVHVRDKYGNASVKHGEARSVTAHLKGPSELDCGTEDMTNGSYTITYEPTVSGQHKLYVRWNEHDTVGSPFDVLVLPGAVHAGKSTAEGEGLTKALCGTPAKFSIVTRDQFKNKITQGSASIEVVLHQEGREPVIGTVVDNKDGTYVITYTLFYYGNYQLRCLIGGKPVQGSPFTVLAAADKIDANVTVAEGQGLSGGVPSGETLYLTVRPKDKHGNATTLYTVGDFSASLEGYEKIACDIKQNNAEGTINLSSKPTHPGEYSLHVKYGKTAIKGSPYRITVLAGKASAAHTIAEGEGLQTAVSGRRSTFVVFCKDEKGNPIHLGGALVSGYLDGPEKIPFEVVDRADGSYNVAYIPVIAGTFNLHVTLDGYAVQNSPFKVQVSPSGASSKNSIAYGPGTIEAIAGVDAPFTVEVRDAQDNVVLNDSKIRVSAILRGPAAQLNSIVASNGDGTYGGEYRAEKAGKYQLEVEVNGEQVKDSPFSVAVSAAELSISHTEATGKGLEESVAGEKSKFFVYTKDSHGNVVKTSPISVSLTGAGSDAVAAVEEIADGFAVEYTVLKAGTFKLNVSAGGAALKGSPFSVNVHPNKAHPDSFVVEGKGLSEALSGGKSSFLVRGKDSYGNDINTKDVTMEASLVRQLLKGSPAFSRQEGLLGLSRKEITGEDEQIRVNFVQNKDGTYNGEYTLVSSGQYLLKVTGNGKALKGSPFLVSVEAGEVDPLSTLVQGRALSSPVTSGDEISLTVLPRDNLGNPAILAANALEVKVDPEAAGFAAKHNPADGTYALVARAAKPGKYKVSVTLGGKPVKGSPFEINVSAGAISAKNTYADGEGINNSTSGVLTKVTVHSEDDKGNAITTGGANITASLIGPEELVAYIADNHDGTYSVTYTPKLAGSYTFNIKSEGLAIKNAPFTVSVAPGALDALHSTATGTGTVESPAGKPAKFVVQTKDSVGNNLKVGGLKVHAALTGPKAINVNIVDNKDGSYSAEYEADQAGVYELQVTVDSKPVKDSPFKVEISAGAADAKHTTADGKGLAQVVANELAFFVVTTKDAHGNVVTAGGSQIAAHLRHLAGKDAGVAQKAAEGLGGLLSVGASAKVDVGPVHLSAQLQVGQAPITVQDNHDGTYTADFTPAVAGDYEVDVTMNGTPIQGSPFKLHVEAGAASTSNTTAEGEGLAHAVSGSQSAFKVITRDSKGNLVGKGGNKVEVSLKGPEKLEGTVTDKHDGTYEAHYTPLLAGNYSLRVKVDNQHIKDSPFKLAVASGPIAASKCTATGDSISKATVGIAEKFLIHAKDAAGNNLKAGGAQFHGFLEGVEELGASVGIGKERRINLQVVDLNDGTYSVEYSPVFAGQYRAHIKLGDVDIKDSPFVVSVAPGAYDAAHSTLEGEGLLRAVAGEPERFVVVLRDKHGNRLLGSPANVGLVATIDGATEQVIHDHKDGTFRVQYRIGKLGPKKVDVTLDGVPISGSPFTVEVDPAVASPLHSYAHGDGLTAAVAGKEASFTIQSLDAFDNKVATGGLAINSTLDGPSKVSARVIDNKDGTYEVKYITIQSGIYKIFTSFASGGDIKDSPHVLTVRPGEAHGDNLAFDEIVPSPTGVAGEPFTVKLSGRDAYGNVVNTGGLHVSAVAQHEDGTEETLNVKDLSDGIYLAEHSTTKSGIYNFIAKVGGAVTKASPHRYEIKSKGVSSDASVLEGPESFAAGVPAVFVIRLKDEYGNPVAIPAELAAQLLIGDDKYPATITSTEPGVYQIVFKPTKSGPASLEASINGHALKGTPKSVKGLASRALPELTKVYFGDATGKAAAPGTAHTSKAGAPTAFSVQFGDEFGNIATPAATAVRASLRPQGVTPVLGLVGNQPRGRSGSGPGPSLSRTPSTKSLSAMALTAQSKSTANIPKPELAAVDAKLAQNEKGLFVGAVTPKSVGKYLLDVSLDGMPVKDSPFEVNVEPGDLSPQNAVVEGSLQGSAGEPIRLTLGLCDANGNRIVDPAVIAKVAAEATLEGEGASGVVPVVTQNPDGTFTLEFKVARPGHYKLGVKVNGVAINDSPFAIAMEAASVSPANCTASGAGLHAANAGEEAVFEVFTKDKNNNNLLSGGDSVASFLQGPEKINVAIVDNNDGSYNAKYTVRSVGDYKLHVVVDGKPIHESPFAVVVKAGKANPDASIVIGDFNDLKAGRPASFIVKLRDGTGNPCATGDVKIESLLIFDDDALVNGEKSDVEVVNNGDGTYHVNVPGVNKSGKYLFLINLDGHPLKGSPFSVNIQAGAARKVTFSGPSLSAHGSVSAVAGENCELLLQLSDEFGNIIKGGGRDVDFKIDGPSKLTCRVVDKENGFYSVPFKLNVAGDYKVHLSVDGHNIPSALAFAVGANVISSAHTIALGNGIRKAKAGEEATFMVQSIDKFGNEVQVGGAQIVARIKGPDTAENPSEYVVEIVDNEDGIYNARYTTDTAGIYHLNVTADGHPIAQSPFVVRVASGVAVAHRSVVKQLSDMPAGKARSDAGAFKIHLADRNGNMKSKGGDELDVYLRKPIRKPAKIIDNKDGTYDVIYPKGLELGEYEVVAELKGERIAIPNTSVQVEESTPLPEEESSLVSSLLPNSSSLLESLLRDLDDDKKAMLLADLKALKRQ